MDKRNAIPQLAVGQNFYISQRMINSLQLLQMDSLSLEAYITEQLMENPVLEFPAVQKKTSGELRWEAADEKGAGVYDTLEFFLLDQLGRMEMPERLRGLCRWLIGCLDENGYLQPDALTPELCAQKEFSAALGFLQSMEPAGVGARDLKECLLLQLQRLEEENALARTMIHQHLEDISRRNYGKIEKSVGASSEEIREAVRLIISLNPRPGAAFSVQEKTIYVHPDFRISVEEGKVEIFQQPHSFPELKVSDHYWNLLRETKDPEVRRYLKERIRLAKQLITGLENRKSTALHCVEAIVEIQRQFFCSGSRQLVPLTQEMVAKTLDLHISTVSRAVSGKYLEFEGELYPLKYFFARRLGGSSVLISSDQIRVLIGQIVSGEDPRHPLSDQQIVELLEKGGAAVSRRTVAKYREQLGIPASKQRRKL